jgi:fatty acid desaturase
MTTKPAQPVAVTEKALIDPDLKAALQTLRQTDNRTNWYYILRTYLYLAVVIGGTVWFYSYQISSGISFWWNVPITLVAIVLVGAGQHQLSGLSHEGVHHTLFKNRTLNDLASDWLTMFPLYSSIHHYRLQHLAHHQFVNDPDRDPDISQLKTSGHWLNFPIEKRSFWRTLLKQLWIPRLIRFMRVRATYNATGTGKNPYLLKGKKPSKVAVRIGLLYIVSLIGALVGLFYVRDPLLLAVVPAAMWIIISFIYWRLPGDKFHQSRVHPVIPLRYMTMMRLGYITVLFTALAELTLLTGHLAVVYYLLLWVVPLFTSFSFFMILRQLVQHGNGDRGWLTNTRTFLVGRLINFAVFPIGQNYHLPHHIYATIPHYRLRKLHQKLMEYPEYQEHAVTVEGYFLPPRTPQTNPTVVDVLGPEYAAKHTDEVSIDNSVMEGDEFEGKDELLEEGKSLAAMWAGADADNKLKPQSTAAS